ncbi:hypothetical protein [Enterobacter sp. 168J2]|uniref:hypothetical protein n=1 Tax=Enterobacter sp. 168J2 TaxID=3077758 RepID=UPI002A83D48B|nr:hypothetical protein [Enterobacter sp. 168J2]
MKEFKGTPGEWFVNKVSDKFIDARLENGKLQSVAWCGDVDVGDRMANVNLIAAAPNLLKELQKLREYVINICDVDEEDCHIEHPLMSSRAAISKALGEE